MKFAILLLLPVSLCAAGLEAGLSFLKSDAPGVVAVTDNADIANHESFQAPERHAFQGQCEAAIRATAARGSLTVTASSAGLPPASVKIEVAQ